MKDHAADKVKAQVIAKTDAETLQGFVEGSTAEDAQIFTDEVVKYSVGESVREPVRTNGMERLRVTLKCGQKGMYHRMLPKHRIRYVNEFSGRHNTRELDTIDEVQGIVFGMAGKCLLYRDLILDNGLSSGARS